MSDQIGATGWLGKILQMAADLPASFLLRTRELDDEKCPTDKVIGTLPESLVRLRGVYMQLAHQANATIIAHQKKMGGRHAHSSETCAEFSAEYAWLKREHEAVAEFFWVSAMHHFGLKGNDPLLLRKGDVLVRDTSQEGHAPMDYTTIAIQIGDVVIGGQSYQRTRES